MSQLDDAPPRSYVRQLRKREENTQDKPAEESTEVKRKIAGDSGWTAEDKVPEPAEKIIVEEGVDEFVTTLQDDDDITQQVAQAPELVQPKIQTIKELNCQIQQLLPANIDTHGYNLSVLASSLYPWELVTEKDVVWDHSQLLKKLSTELEKKGTEVLELDEDTYIEFICNMCKHRIPFAASRYHCTMCEDFDMCTTCFADGKGHDSTHEHHVQLFLKCCELSVWGFC